MSPRRNPRFTPQSPASLRLGRSAFTIIELLVVVAIIIILLSLVLLAMNSASKSAQRARTTALMDSMKKALISFKEEIGYYPPMLGPGNATPNQLRQLFNPPDPALGTYAQNMQDYYSTAAMADYLIGYGSHREDGYGVVAGAAVNQDWDAETPAVGIRHPGTDGVWGATIYGTASGGLIDRMKTTGTNWPSEFNAANPSATPEADLGKKYGPYLELSDERLLASTDGQYVQGSTAILNTYFPGDAGYVAGQPKIIVDYWGAPIRYYRRPYPTGALNQSYRAIDRDGDGDVDRVPVLSDVFLLRPWDIKSGSESVGLPDAAGNAVTTRELDSAEFALFSSGPDRSLNEDITVDPEEFNKDNTVVIGP